MIYNTSLVGISFRPMEAKDIVSRLVAGQKLTLERQPTNAYDAFAIKVIEPESQILIGYIEKFAAREMNLALATAGSYTCEVFYPDKRRPQLKISIDEGHD
jgi:HIRAN domain